ncbi:biotin/lipoyl-containing protein [Thalassovita taeanensis]|uniref:Biotin-requiring enzyme n=1 Tax=Thalassovita taeanensis TaxID=657014 RepID=A0A1H8ZEU2_9RHOB|nr:biotin/lipoyl-containing protein [Thalassovita taeanensis]SEP62926.1 Biotin-requiring enzyme [Thalassovita taeanensis]
MTDIIVPEGLWDADVTPEGIVSNWFFADGATVSKDSVVAEIMVEKSTFDIETPTGGVLKHSVPKDGVIRPGTVIGTVNAG